MENETVCSVEGTNQTVIPGWPVGILEKRIHVGWSPLHGSAVVSPGKCVFCSDKIDGIMNSDEKQR